MKINNQKIRIALELNRKNRGVDTSLCESQSMILLRTGPFDLQVFDLDSNYLGTIDLDKSIDSEIKKNDKIMEMFS